MEESLTVSSSRMEGENKTAKKRHEDPPLSKTVPEIKIRAKRGLSGFVLKESDENASLNHGLGVYGNQINIFRQKKKQLNAEVAEIIHRIQDTEKQDKHFSSCDDQSEKLHVLITPPPLDVKCQSKHSNKKMSKLLRKLENKQDQYLKEKEIMQKKGIELTTDCLCGSEEEVDDLICLADDDSVIRNITLKIRFKAKILRYTMSMNDSFSKVIKTLADENNILTSQVLLTINDKVINQNHSPTSIGLSVVDIIEFGIMNEDATLAKAIAQQVESENVLLLKVQSKNSRAKIEIKLKMDDCMTKLMEEYAKQTGSNLEKLTFKFDGEQINSNSTPEELELEDGFCIDVVESQ